MPQDVTRNLGPSKSQSVTYEAIGQAEDLSDILYNIDPASTPILSHMAEGKEVTATDTSWMAKHLEPPGVNAHLEVEEYKYGHVGSVEGMHNFVQHFQNTGMISDTQRKVKKTYKVPGGDALSEAMTDAFTKQAKDIEYALINNDVANAENGTNPAKMGGIPYFMKLNSLDVTVNSTDGTFTTAEDNNLRTGDFIYITADKTPAGMKSGVPYYVRVDDTSPKTKFTLYNRMKDAVETGVGAKLQVKPTDAGSGVKIVNTNVKSLGNASTWKLTDLDDVMAMAASRGGKPTDAWMSMENKRLFSQNVTALSTTYRVPKDRYGSGVADTYETDGGVITAHSHLMWDPTRIDILDNDYWEIRYFEKTHEVKNLPKTGTYDKYVIESALTLQGSQPKASAAIIDIKRA